MYRMPEERMQKALAQLEVISEEDHGALRRRGNDSSFMGGKRQDARLNGTSA